MYKRQALKLADKGPVIAPPVLSGWAQKASLEIQSWPGIIPAMHWSFGRQEGVDFYVADAEVGHIHFDGEVHLVMTKAVQKAVIDSGLAEPFRWAANWVQLPITNELSAQHAQWLFRLAYDRVKGAHETDLLKRVELAGLSAESTTMTTA